MAPKRKATGEPDSEDPTPYHVNFPLYPEADLVVESSDGVFFATRALFLRAASSVFDDILVLPAQEDKKDGLPLIKIEEVSAIFEVFLRYAHRERHLVDGQPPTPSWSTVLLLSTLFDKYDSPILAKSILIEHLPRFTKDPLVSTQTRDASVLAGTAAPLAPVIEVFAIAVIHGLEEAAQRTLRSFHSRMRRTPGTMTLTHNAPDDLNKMKRDFRPRHLGDLSPELFVRLPPSAAQRFCSLHSKVLTTPGYSWSKAGDDFNL